MSKIIKAEYTVVESDILLFAIAKGYKQTLQREVEDGIEIETYDNPEKAETFFANHIKQILTREISSVALQNLRNTKREEEANQSKVILDTVKDDLVISVN